MSPPQLVFGDLQQWLRDNRAKIGRQTVDPAAVVVAKTVSDAKTSYPHDDVPQSNNDDQQQQISKKKVSFAASIIQPPKSTAANVAAKQGAIPKKQKTLSFFTTEKDNMQAKVHVESQTQLGVEKKASDKQQPTNAGSHKKKQRAIPKAPIGTPQITLIQTHNNNNTSGKDGVFQDFNWWRTLRNTAVLCTAPLPQNKTTRALCAATFRERVIDQLTQMYHLKVLPGGAAIGVGAVCDKLEGREMKRVPAFLPTKATYFGKKEQELQATREQFSSLWFRVCFVKKVQHSNEIVHFKDLLKENNAEALKPLLTALFVHLAHGDDQLLRVMSFALDTALS